MRRALEAQNLSQVEVPLGRAGAEATKEGRGRAASGSLGQGDS